MWTLFIVIWMVGQDYPNENFVQYSLDGFETYEDCVAEQVSLQTVAPYFPEFRASSYCDNPEAR